MNSELKLREALHKYDEFDGKNATEQLSKAEKTIEIFRQALAAEPEQVEPLFWYRPRSDGGYEGPLHNDTIDTVRKECGAWVALYIKPTPLVRLTEDEAKSASANGQMEAQRRGVKSISHWLGLVEVMNDMIEKNVG
jgi:hypothetical protein